MCELHFARTPYEHSGQPIYSFAMAQSWRRLSDGLLEARVVVAGPAPLRRQPDAIRARVAGPAPIKRYVALLSSAPIAPELHGERGLNQSRLPTPRRFGALDADRPETSTTATSGKGAGRACRTVEHAPRPAAAHEQPAGAEGRGQPMGAAAEAREQPAGGAVEPHE